MEIEIIFTYTKSVNKEEEPQKKEDLEELLEKIKKYGMFNDKGEWVHEG